MWTNMRHELADFITIEAEHKLLAIDRCRGGASSGPHQKNLKQTTTIRLQPWPRIGRRALFWAGRKCVCTRGSEPVNVTLWRPPRKRKSGSSKASDEALRPHRRFNAAGSPCRLRNLDEPCSLNRRMEELQPGLGHHQNQMRHTISYDGRLRW